MQNNKRNMKLKMISVLSATFLLLGIVSNSSSLSVKAAMATGKDKWVGNIWYDSSVPSQFATYWNQITPENATKWASCEPQQGVYNFSTAKTMYNYCKTNAIPFKFHTLIWGGQYPSWVNNLSSASRKTEVENWIKNAGANFPNAEFVDVVNEAMPGHNPPSWRNDIGGDNGLYGTGWDWVVWSFEKARQYFPNSKLLINDYNVLCDNYSCIDTYIKVINILKARGLIDGIGCQSHGLETVNVANVKSKLDRLAATGVPIYISELDLNIADDNAQKNKMQELFPVLYEHSAVKGITLWGYLQGHTWVSNSYLIRSNGTERPALTWLKQYLSGTSNNTTKVECENMTLGGTYAGKITSPFNGVVLYGNNDYCSYNQYFAYSSHSFSLRGCSSNSSTARVDLQIAGKTVGSFYFTGTTPTVQTLSNVSHDTGNVEMKLVVTTDNGSWDANIDYLEYK